MLPAPAQRLAFARSSLLDRGAKAWLGRDPLSWFFLHEYLEGQDCDVEKSAGRVRSAQS